MIQRFEIPKPLQIFIGLCTLYKQHSDFTKTLFKSLVARYSKRRASACSSDECCLREVALCGNGWRAGVVKKGKLFAPILNRQQLRQRQNALTNPHIIIPDSKAIRSVSTNTGQPERTELNTALADVPGGSSTTMKATPGELTSGMNMYSL